MNKAIKISSSEKKDTNKEVQTKAKEVKDETKVERNNLIEEVIDFLTTYKYHPTKKGVGKIVDEWRKNNQWIIDGFKNNADYNGHYQIVKEAEFSRPFDVETVEKFRQFLRSDNVEKMYALKEYTAGAFSMKEISSYIQKNNTMIEIIDSQNVKTIDGKDRSYYEAQVKHWLDLESKIYKDNDEAVEKMGVYYEKSSYKNKYIMIRLLEFLNEIRDSKVDDYWSKTFNCVIPELRLEKGQKVSRAVNKILSTLKINTVRNYDKEFAKFSDAVNPSTIKRKMIISVHPIDYLSSSFGNSWTSCHCIDRKNVRNRPQTSGCGFSGGNLSYMMDNSTVITYTLDESFNGERPELEDKINRNLFHFGKKSFVQARVYPQKCDSDCDSLYKELREVIQQIYEDCFGIKNLWITPKVGIESCGNVTETTGVHYKDYLTNNGSSNVNIPKDFVNDEKEIIKIGHVQICPCCGKEYSREGYIECKDCYVD